VGEQKKPTFICSKGGCQDLLTENNVFLTRHTQFVYHLAQATQVVNPQEFTLRKRTIKKCYRLVDKMMASEKIQNILTDDTLDN